MKTIRIINSKQKSCGVYQYGVRLLDALQHSTNKILYSEVANFQEFVELDFNEVDLLLFNFIGCDGQGPFGWFRSPQAEYIKNHLKIKTATINHTADNFAPFDYYICQNPTNPSGLVLPRPLHSPITYNPTNEVLNVGSFGFAGDHKGFDTILHLVNTQLDKAVVNFRITSAYYGDPNCETRTRITEYLKQIPLKPGITLNIYNDFLDDASISQFAAQNDILLFPYKVLPSSVQDPCAISSIADYAISWNIPFGVTNVPAFRHVYRPEIDVNLASIESILAFHKKSYYVDILKHTWSQQNLANSFDEIVKHILE
jgi:hypothetical protein